MGFTNSTGGYNGDPSTKKRVDEARRAQEAVKKRVEEATDSLLSITITEYMLPQLTVSDYVGNTLAEIVFSPDEARAIAMRLIDVADECDEAL